jgi:predicted ATPase
VTLQRFQIAGFKRFASCELEFAPLTVLTGTNGAGKTSVIQALLLAHEACAVGAKTVALNGPFDLQLGSAQDVLNLHTALESSTITLRLQLDDNPPAAIVLDAGHEHAHRGGSSLYLPILERPNHITAPLGGSGRDFVYLGAERLGPRDVLGASASPSEDLSVGVRGEFSAQVLELHGLSTKIESIRRCPARNADVDAFLKYQVEAWLSDVVRPVELDTVWFSNTNVTALRFRAPGDEWVRAPNMGFGVSYALPIILAGMFINPGGLLIIENPEAHLHPAGQSRMGYFVSMLAASGVQVVVETHSDHVLNGIRRAIGESGLLAHQAAVVHFFDQEGNSALHFNRAGNLDTWPSRFFDQYQIDVSALARARRGPAK